MINELYYLSEVLKKHGLMSFTSHKDVKEPANQPGLFIEIDVNKKPVSIEYYSSENFVKLWKHSKGNHNSFPVVRIQKPILDHKLANDFNEAWKNKSINEKKIFIKEQFIGEQRIIGEFEVADWTKEQLIPICQKSDDLKALSDLMERFPSDNSENANFTKQLCELIKSNISSYDDKMIELIKDILIGSYDESKSKKDKKVVFSSKTQIAFDVLEYQKYRFKVTDPRLKKILINELLSRDLNKENDAELPNETCYLTGLPAEIEYNSYPQPKLPVLGLSYIYSMNTKAIQCQSRYGMQEQESFLASKDIITEINNALAFIVGEDEKARNIRNKKTWIKVPGIKKKELNILIAYVEEFPEADDEFAQMMGGVQDWEQKEISFSVLSEQIVGSLIKRQEINYESRMQILVLNKVDDGRKQILFSSSYNVNNLLNSINIWNEASTNVPIIQYKIKIKGENRTIKPQCPYPAQLLLLMQNKWKWVSKDGKHQFVSIDVPGILLKEVYDIFIPIKDEKHACMNILPKVVNHTKDLLVTIGHLSNRNEVYEAKVTALYDLCLAVSFISIILYKLGYNKEVYMHSVAFNIGRLMKLSDILHREYCLNVRASGEKSKGIPSQLIGNAIMATASEFPNRGLDQLRERIRIYQAWAEKTPDAGIARWALKNMGHVTLEIAENIIPDTFNEIERAQVLLGYLATIEKEEVK